MGCCLLFSALLMMTALLEILTRCRARQIQWRASVSHRLELDGVANAHGVLNHDDVRVLRNDVQHLKKKLSSMRRAAYVLAPEHRTHIVLPANTTAHLISSILKDERTRTALATALARGAHAASATTTATNEITTNNFEASHAFLVESGAIVVERGAKAQPWHQDTSELGTREFGTGACSTSSGGDVDGLLLDAQCLEARIVTVQLYLQHTSERMGPLETLALDVDGTRVGVRKAGSVPEGSAVLFDSRTVHRGGAMRSDYGEPEERVVAYVSFLGALGSRPAGGTYACDGDLFERRVELSSPTKTLTVEGMLRADRRAVNPFDRGGPTTTTTTSGQQQPNDDDNDGGRQRNVRDRVRQRRSTTTTTDSSSYNNKPAKQHDDDDLL